MLALVFLAILLGIVAVLGIVILIRYHDFWWDNFK